MPVVFCVALPLFMLGALWVVFRWAVDSFAWLADRRRALLAAIAVLVVGQPIVGWVVLSTHARVALLVQTATFVGMLTIALAAIPIAFARALAWGLRRAKLSARQRRLGGTGEDPVQSPGAITRRQMVLRIGG